jgi:hypothetical protein
MYREAYNLFQRETFRGLVELFRRATIVALIPTV